MPPVPNPLGPSPVYNTSTIACDMGGLYDSGAAVLQLATLVAENLRTIVLTLNGLKGAGAWLGPSSDGAEQLFTTFNGAATELFNDSPPGLLAAIGSSLLRASLNYAGAEDAIEAMFDAFVTTGGSGSTGGTTPNPGNPVVVTTPPTP